jgi:hypothetical protein
MEITIGIVIIMALIPALLVTATRIMKDDCEGED